MRDYSENHFFNRAASNLNLSIRYRGAAYYNFLSRTPSGRDYTSKLDELINERFNEQLSNSETN